eukprot:g764.t1
MLLHSHLPAMISAAGQLGRAASIPEMIDSHKKQLETRKSFVSDGISKAHFGKDCKDLNYDDPTRLQSLDELTHLMNIGYEAITACHKDYQDFAVRFFLAARKKIHDCHLRKCTANLEDAIETKKSKDGANFLNLIDLSLISKEFFSMVESKVRGHLKERWEELLKNYKDEIEKVANFFGTSLDQISCYWIDAMTSFHKFISQIYNKLDITKIGEIIPYMQQQLIQTFMNGVFLDSKTIADVAQGIGELTKQAADKGGQVEDAVKKLSEDIAKIIATAEVMGTIKWTGDIMGNIGAGAKLAGDLLANAGDPTAAMTGFGIDKQVKERKEFVEKNFWIEHFCPLLSTACTQEQKSQDGGIVPASKGFVCPNSDAIKEKIENDKNILDHVAHFGHGWADNVEQTFLKAQNLRI